MAGKWNLSNNGDSCPLLGADFSGNPVADAPGPYAPPDGAETATAPPSYLMDNVSGYEGTSTGDDGKFLPPPKSPSTGPGNAIPGPDVQWSIPSITEDTAKQAFLEYSKSKCCYSSAPVKHMVFHDFKSFNTYRYRLETFTESRTTGWKTVPYNDEVIDAYGSGAVPPPWDVPVQVPAMFQDSTTIVKVPHTSSVKPCQTCLGLGQNICKTCHGAGRIQCSMCRGIMVQMNERCTRCNGIGNTSCPACGGGGRTTCTVCMGKRLLLCYIQMKVTWKNYIYEFLADQNTGFSADLFKEVTGQKLFVDEKSLVYPLKTFPDALINQASKNAIQRHVTQFASTCHILRQRQTIELIPLTKVDYAWKGKPHNYFVYGVENQVFTDDYPAKCCCSVM